MQENKKNEQLFFQEEHFKCETESDDSSLEIQEIYKKINVEEGKRGRLVRILSEFIQVQNILRDENIFFTVVMFGSARSYSHESYECRKNELESRLSEIDEKIKKNIPLVNEEIKEYEKLQKDFEALLKLKWTTKYYNQIYELSKKLTLFFATDEGKEAVNNLSILLPRNRDYIKAKHMGTYRSMDNSKYMDELKCNGKDPSNIQNEKTVYNVAICTGGGPGFMEAANKGSKDANGKSLGFMISLPFEKEGNKYIDKHLSFKFHYFFTRKFWLIYLSLAFIVFPGGFGTLDELLEILTLKQCKKLKKNVPIVLFGKDFWASIINFNKLVDYGLVSQGDVDNIFVTDCVDEACNYIIDYLKSKSLANNT
ncbi:lysine decarboxylase-like protein, putative [Hepatocystis sp. ex Piliocolobus tephrosceles]|nr:lysine decarboxylase-like protein, putative [Hepatocystis sp. ex Piliocolobus tephrosceles]